MDLDTITDREDADSAINNETLNKCRRCDILRGTWHCSTCDDFKLCDICYNQDSAAHPHPMKRISLLTSEADDTSEAENKYDSIYRCIDALAHSCECHDAGCNLLGCYKFKRLVLHAKSCQKRIESKCIVCHQLIMLCCFHAKRCQSRPCVVPFCTNIRLKLNEKKLLAVSSENEANITLASVSPANIVQPQPNPSELE